MSPYFDRPLWLLGLLLVPLMGWAWWYARHQRRQAARVLLELRARRWRTEESGTALLGATGTLLLVLWAAGPGGTQESRSGWQERDLVVVLDASASMLASDVAPSRLERARELLQGVGDPAGRRRVALLSVAGDVRLECPWTVDRAAFQSLLRDVQPASHEWGGSDLAEGLERGLDLFAPGRSGALLLVSDGAGDDDVGRREQVLAKARAQDIPVFTLCVGTEAGGPLTIPGQEEVTLRARPEVLARIAAQTGGEPVPSTGPVGDPSTAPGSLPLRSDMALGRWCLLLGFLAWVGECFWRGRR